MIEENFNDCLFFTSDRLNKIATKIAENEFKKLKMTPKYVYLLIEVKHNNGISEKELREKLSLTPSTIKRLLNKLVKDGLLTIETENTLSNIYLTKAGKEIQKNIEKSILNLNEIYKELLSEGNCNTLVRLTNSGAILLENSKL